MRDRPEGEGGAVAEQWRPVQDALRRSGGAGFSLFQLLRLLEQLHPERRPVGGFGDPGAEVARLSQNPSLAFPAREVESLDLEGEGPLAVQANVFGLVGAMGVLPHNYSTLVLERQRARDASLRSFLDLFHHRLLSLFYQAWRKGLPELALERGEEDVYRRHLLDLVGMGHEPAEAYSGTSTDPLAWYAGLLAPPARSGPALEQLLADRYGTEVEVEPFVGGWLRLEEMDLCFLGEEEDGMILGGGVVVGDEIWDPHARIRIRMGPLTRAQYDDLLPGAPGNEDLRRLARFFTHDQFEIELQLILARDEVPGTVLGGEARWEAPLGWSTWLRSRPRLSDADETILTL
jgi:type VI secretion system protein ImpH